MEKNTTIQVKKANYKKETYNYMWQKGVNVFNT